MRRHQIGKMSNKKYRTYTFADATWMCFFLIVVACTFLRRIPLNPIRLCASSVISVPIDTVS